MRPDFHWNAKPIGGIDIAKGQREPAKTETKQIVKPAGNAPQIWCPGGVSHEGFAMRKVLLLAASLTVAGFMLHGAFACELNREASQPAPTIVPDRFCIWGRERIIAQGSVNLIRINALSLSLFHHGEGRKVRCQPHTVTTGRF